MTPPLPAPAALVLLAAFAVGAASAGGRGCEDASCAARGNSLLQSGSRVSFKDSAAAHGDDGFTIHLFNSKESMQNPDSVVVRPLFKKTYKCRTVSPSSCEECAGGATCFDTRQQEDGKEFLYVRAKKGGRWRPWQHHRIRVNFHCPEASQFTVSARVRMQGRLNKVYMKVDGQPASGRVYNVGGGRRSVLFATPWNSTRGRVLELDLHFVMFWSGWAKVKDIQIQTSSEYLACQDHKTCLRVLEGTEGGLALRNDNQLQLSCLDGKLPDNDACSQWKTCLDSVMSTSRIRTLLLAAGVNESSRPAAPTLLEADAAQAAVGADLRTEGGEERVAAEEAEEAEGSAQQSVVKQVPGFEDSCIDPRIDDPESWLCSCLDRMEETCLAISNAFQPEEWSSRKCLTAQMCVDPLGQVCSTWKAAVGCNGTEYAELTAALIAYISGTGPTLAPSSSPTPAPAATSTAAPDPLVALFDRAKGTWGARRGVRLLDSSVGGKASACE